MVSENASDKNGNNVRLGITNIGSVTPACSYAGKVRKSTNSSAVLIEGTVCRPARTCCQRRPAAHGIANGLQLVGQNVLHQLDGDLRAVGEASGRMADPLPDLGARDFGRGGVFHQVEDRHAAVAAQPAFEIAKADGDVGAQALGVISPCGTCSRSSARDSSASSWRNNWFGPNMQSIEHFQWQCRPGPDARPRCRRDRRRLRAPCRRAPWPSAV